MNKLLVVLLATGVMAFCAINHAGAKVTVYGQLHLSVDNLNNGTESSLYLSNNNSRVGIKGSQKLGMGLTGEFQYDVLYDPTRREGGVGHARTNFIALSGNFGKLTLGRLDGVMKNHIDRYQMFGDQLGDAGNFLAGQNRIGRYDNIIQYSRSINKSNVSIGVIPEEGEKNSGGLLLGMDYSTKSFFIGLGYTIWGKGNTPTFTSAVDQKTTQILTNYKLDRLPLRVMAVYQTTSNFNKKSTEKLEVIGVGIAYDLNPQARFKSHYYTAGETVSNAENGATMLVVGVDYILSDTTRVYVVYAGVNNEKNASYTPFRRGRHGDATPTVSTGKDPSGISMGVVYRF